MKKYLLAPALMLASALAFAGVPVSISMGNADQLQELIPVPLKNAEGESLLLGYRTTRVVFGLGLYIKNQGYVLIPAGRSRAYYSLEANDIEAMQHSGVLPKDLPPHTLPLQDYLVGYSLWIAIAIAAFYVWYTEKRAKRRQGVEVQRGNDA